MAPHLNARLSFIVFLALALAMTPAAGASHDAPSEPAARIVALIAEKVEASYPFPDLGHDYARRLRSALAKGLYRSKAGKDLVLAINADLQAVHKDRHLKVYFNHDLYVQASVEAGAPDTKADKAHQRTERLNANFGFTEVSVDPVDSTTYIKSSGPWWPEQKTFETAAGALALAAQSRNIIIDLRGNPGGAGEVGRFLATYFFDVGDEQFYLNGFGRTSDQNQQEWTYSFVPGRRLTKAKVYILIDKRTGSAAEGFAFAMQRLHRATIVGEASAGAGIAGSFKPLADDMVLFLPVKMVVAPNTMEGWEGTGVTPDLPTEGDARAFIEQRIHSEVSATGGATAGARAQGG